MSFHEDTLVSFRQHALDGGHEPAMTLGAQEAVAWDDEGGYLIEDDLADREYEIWLGEDSILTMIVHELCHVFDHEQAHRDPEAWARLREQVIDDARTSARARRLEDLARDAPITPDDVESAQALVGASSMIDSVEQIRRQASYKLTDAELVAHALGQHVTDISNNRVLEDEQQQWSSCAIPFAWADDDFHAIKAALEPLRRSVIHDRPQLSDLQSLLTPSTLVTRPIQR